MQYMANEHKELLESFLIRWDLATLNKMTIDQYVGIGNKDTFCQWVETKTRLLGSIKGMPSIKFGIYERKNPQKKLKNYANDDIYTWLRGYGKNSNEAFNNVKDDILNIIQLSEKGKFDQIDKIMLPDLFKWKIAFLYSNERLVPVFKRKVLLAIANNYGRATDRNTTVSEIQATMIANKPTSLNVYQYMYNLFERFGREKDRNGILNGSGRTNGRRKRKRASRRNIKAQLRTVSRSYLAEQKHNKIQERLKELLILEFGDDNVVLEENHVDVKVIQPSYLGFYEVKSASYASECIKQALGQVLLYVHDDGDKREKKIFVVGQFPANGQDQEYIDYVKSHLNIEFDYLDVDIE